MVRVASGTDERVADCEATNDLSVLHVLGVDRSATRLLRSGENARIIDAELVAARDLDRPFVNIDGHRFDLKIGAKARHSARHIIPAQRMLLPCNGSELVQHLDADDRAAAGEFESTGVPRIVGEQIDEDIRVEERVSHANSLRLCRT